VDAAGDARAAAEDEFVASRAARQFSTDENASAPMSPRPALPTF
jgi:hypothetical protein